MQRAVVQNPETDKTLNVHTTVILCDEAVCPTPTSKQRSSDTCVFRIQFTGHKFDNIPPFRFDFPDKMQSTALRMQLRPSIQQRLARPAKAIPMPRCLGMPRFCAMQPPMAVACSAAAAGVRSKAPTLIQVRPESKNALILLLIRIANEIPPLLPPSLDSSSQATGEEPGHHCPGSGGRGIIRGGRCSRLEAPGVHLPLASPALCIFVAH